MLRAAFLDGVRTGLDLVTVESSLAFLDRDRSADGLQDPTAAALTLAEYLASIIGASALAILHYGSRAQGRVVRPDSAFDFFILVDRYGPAYRALATAVGARSRPRLAVALAWILPPNVVSVRQQGSFGEREAKCVIISKRHFQRECSTRARDQFVRGRLSQHIVRAWTRDAASAEEVGRWVREARDSSFDWLQAFLPAVFDVDQYCRSLLAVSIAHEIRLEARDHAETLFAAQRDTLRELYGPVLNRLAARGVLERDGEKYVQRHLPGALTRLRVHTRLRISKWRTTLRLLKHPFLYDGWLDYLLRKIERSTGEKIELTDRERRRPLIFLWPRAWRHLRRRPQLRR